MGNYNKSRTLDLCSHPLLLEIINTDLDFCPLPDSALWYVLFTRGCSNTGMASLGQGITQLSWVPFQNLEGGVPWQVVALDLIYSCLSQMCALVLCLHFQINRQSSHPAMPTSPLVCRPTPPIAMAQVVAGKSLSYQVSFFLAMPFLSFCHIWVLTLHFSCKWQVFFALS